MAFSKRMAASVNAMLPADLRGLVPVEPERTRANVAGGQLAHANGDELEDWCAAQHARALDRGLLARMAHVGAPGVPHIIRGRLAFDDRGRPLFALVKHGPADYQGQLTKAHGGRSVALEAKSKAGRLVRDEHIPAHQQRDLERCAEGGGLAALVYRCTRESDAGTFAIPWRDVPWARGPQGGAPSIAPADVARWRVDARCHLHPLDAGWRFYLQPLIDALIAREGEGE